MGKIPWTSALGVFLLQCLLYWFCCCSVAETEKHGFSFSAGQQRQQENDTVLLQPQPPPLTLPSPQAQSPRRGRKEECCPSCWTSSFPQRQQLLNGCTKIQMCMDCQNYTEGNRRGKDSSPKEWGESCSEHQQKYVVKNDRW